MTGSRAAFDLPCTKGVGSKPRAVVELLELSLLCDGLLLPDQILLLKLGLLLDVILLYLVFDVLNAHGGFGGCSVDRKGLAEVLA